MSLQKLAFLLVIQIKMHGPVDVKINIFWQVTFLQYLHKCIFQLQIFIFYSRYLPPRWKLKFCPDFKTALVQRQKQHNNSIKQGYPIVVIFNNITIKVTLEMLFTMRAGKTIDFLLLCAPHNNEVNAKSVTLKANTLFHFSSSSSEFHGGWGPLFFSSSGLKILTVLVAKLDNPTDPIIRRLKMFIKSFNRSPICAPVSRK